MFLKSFDPKFKKEWKIGSEIAGTNVCVCIVNIHTYYTITGVQQKKIAYYSFLRLSVSFQILFLSC